MPISDALQQEFFEKRRDALARQYQYGNSLAKVRDRNRILEGALAIFTGGTFITLLGDIFVFPEQTLLVVTSIFGLIAFSLSLLKRSFWKADDDLQRYSELHSTYTLIVFAFEELEDLIITTENVTEELFRNKFAEARRLRKEIGRKEDPDIDQKIAQNKIQNRLDKTLPKEKLNYIPTLERLAEKQEHFQTVPVPSVE